jgi:hypothetical protein
MYRRSNYVIAVLPVTGGREEDVIGDAVIWIRLNGKVQRTTPADMIKSYRFSQLSTEDGQNVLRPVDQLEILTASSRRQQQAEALFARVNYLMWRDVDASTDIYRLHLRGGRKVHITSDHPIMVSKSRVEGGYEAVAVAGRDLTVGNNLLGHANLAFFDGLESDLPDWFFRLAGLWLADGCFVTNKGKPLGKMVISTGNNAAVLNFLRQIPRPKNVTERAAVKLAAARLVYPTQAAAALAVAADMGISVSCALRGVYDPKAMKKDEFIYVNVKKNGDAWMCNLELVEQFKALGFTGNSHTKTVPGWLYTVSQRQIGLFLAGYFDGDGCMSERGPVAASVNHSLIYGVRDLLLRLGIEASIKESSKIGGFRTKTASLFTLCIGATMSIARFIDQVPVTKDIGKLPRRTGGQPDHAFKSRKLQKIERIEHGGCRVFDFEVADTHRFVADSVLVHDSSPPSLWRALAPR